MNILISSVWTVRKSALFVILFSIGCYSALAQQQAPTRASQGAAAYSQTKTIQDPGNGPCPPLVVRADDQTRALAYSPDGQWLATAAEDFALTPNQGRYHVAIWSTVTGKMERKWDTGQLSRQIGFSPNGEQLAFYNKNGKLEVRDFRKDTVLYTLAAGVFAYSPDGKILAIGNSRALLKSEIDQSGQSRYNTVEIHDAATGKLLRSIDISHFNLFSLAISRDGTLFAGSCDDEDICDGSVGTWNLTSGKLLKNYPFEAFAFSPDGQWAGVTGKSGEDSGEVKLIDLSTNTVKSNFGVKAATFNADWTQVALIDKNAIHLNSLSTGSEVRTLPRGLGPLAFSPDGKKLAVANYMSNPQRPITCNSMHLVITTYYSPIKIWDISTGRELFTLGNQASDNNSK